MITYEPGTVVRPTNHTCELAPLRYKPTQHFVVERAERVTPTNRHPISGEYWGGAGEEYMLTLKDWPHKVSSILMQRIAS